MISIEGYYTNADKTFKTRYKKPNSDYFRLDLVIRGKNKGITENALDREQLVSTQTDEILVDYKTYLHDRASECGISITKYLHRLIEKDMCEFCRGLGGHNCDECN